MAQTARQMHLGVYVMGTGHHVAGWRLPEAQAGAENFPLLVRIAQTAERGKFDMIFLADNVCVRKAHIILSTELRAHTSRATHA